MLAEGKETRAIDGRDYVLEYPIHADFALIKAHRGDRLGNLVYRKTARNFGPVMATAAATAIAQVAEIVEVGAARPGDRSSPRASTCNASSRSADARRRRRKANGGRHMTRTAAVRGPLLCEAAEPHRDGAPRRADIPEGAYVNLGIGLPTMVADHLPADRESSCTPRTACSAWARRPTATRSTPT